jgi:hypothetical protein
MLFYDPFLDTLSAMLCGLAIGIVWMIWRQK